MVVEAWSVRRRDDRLRHGSVWDSRSRTTRSSAIFVADGQNNKICVSAQRDTSRRGRASATAAATRDVSAPSAASPSTRRATSTRARAIEGKRVQKFVSRSEEDARADSGTFWISLGVSSRAAAGARHRERALERTGAGQAQGRSCRRAEFEVDPSFPKPLPNHWMLGQTIGLSRRRAGSRVDRASRRSASAPAKAASSQNPPIGECCSKSPPVLEFDQAGNVVRHWGGPGPGL